MDSRKCLRRAQLPVVGIASARAPASQCNASTHPHELPPSRTNCAIVTIAAVLTRALLALIRLPRGARVAWARVMSGWWVSHHSFWSQPDRLAWGWRSEARGSAPPGSAHHGWAAPGKFWVFETATRNFHVRNSLPVHPQVPPPRTLKCMQSGTMVHSALPAMI